MANAIQKLEPRTIGGVLLAITLAGCGTVTPLDSQAFYHEKQATTVQPIRTGPRSRIGPDDEPGRLDPVPVSPLPDQSVTGISPTVAESLAPSTQPIPPFVAAPPSTLPTTEAALSPVPTTLPIGQYVVLGCVLVDVDGTPIYANKVIAKMEKALSVRARDLDEAGFRAFATGQLDRQVQTAVQDEMIYHAAERELEDSDRKIVDLLTTKFRTEEISKAGGSLELARRAAAAEGQDFEQVVEDRHRFLMTEVYYEKKVYPQIIVTAEMVRDYYNRNRDTLFSTKSTATFRLIRIDSKEVGSASAAKARAEDVRARAVAGDDFSQLARDYNHDPYLHNKAGLPMDGPIERGAFGIKEIDTAVWAMQPGQISPVIPAGDSFYIVRVETRVDGRVRPFESEQVQDEITSTLRRDQFRQLRDKENEKLRKNTIGRENDEAKAVAVDMIMQNYPRWHAAGK